MGIIERFFGGMVHLLGGTDWNGRADEEIQILARYED